MSSSNVDPVEMSNEEQHPSDLFHQDFLDWPHKHTRRSGMNKRPPKVRKNAVASYEDQRADTPTPKAKQSSSSSSSKSSSVVRPLQPPPPLPKFADGLRRRARTVEGEAAALLDQRAESWSAPRPTSRGDPHLGRTGHSGAQAGHRTSAATACHSPAARTHDRHPQGK